MTKLQHLKPFLWRNTSRYQYSQNKLLSKMPTNDNDIHCDSSEQKNEKKINRPMYIPETPTRIEDIDEPTNCCMSGCANCVWIEYAEKLAEILKNSPGDIQKLMMEKVQDPNMRAFLSMELRIRKIIE